jgi:hypothetical protein
MTRRYVIGTVLLLALLAAHSCNLMEEQEQASEPIAFSAVVAGGMPATRAANMVAEAGLKGTGFGVFGCYTGLHTYAESSVTTDYMHNQHLTWDDRTSHWIYDPLKYWPNEEGHHVSFFAYAPYSDGSLECIPSFIFDHEVADPWIFYRLAANVNNQVDLLYADPLLDQTRHAIGDPLTFTFKHALACVGDTVRISCTDTFKDALRAQVAGGSCTEVRVILKKVVIEYTLTAKARLVLWNRGAANWNVVQSEEVLTTRTMDFAVGEFGRDYLLWKYSASAESYYPWKDIGHGVFCIPAEANGYGQVAKMTMEYDIVREGGVSLLDHTVTATLPLRGLVQEGKVLNINMEINNLQ